jgi:citrate synthase
LRGRGEAVRPREETKEAGEKGHEYRMAAPGKGLEGVVAAETALSDIDGKKGVLSYVGYDIHDLAPNAVFEEVIYLLHHL